MNATRWLLAMMLTSIGFLATAHADESRHWIARIGVHPVTPKPDSHSSLEVDSGVALSLGATYLFTKHWALELFTAAPVEHEFSIEQSAAGGFDLLPVTLTMQYHVSDERDRVRVFAAAGVAYANLRAEHTRGALTGQALELDDSIGLAAAVGLDMNLGSRWFANVDARWFDIDSRAHLGGQPYGRVELDPYAFGLSIGRRLR